VTKSPVLCAPQRAVKLSHTELLTPPYYCGSYSHFMSSSIHDRCVLVSKADNCQNYTPSKADKVNMGTEWRHLHCSHKNLSRCQSEHQSNTDCPPRRRTDVKRLSHSATYHNLPRFQEQSYVLKSATRYPETSVRNYH